MGDDLVDICLMRKVGFRSRVANACAEVKALRLVYGTIRRQRGCP
jgi:3-deoxy-D-manno-octulosonate 8-phosphate phosphatase KdsC-like HAD superfamily phosphatase